METSRLDADPTAALIGSLIMIHQFPIARR